MPRTRALFVALWLGWAAPCVAHVKLVASTPAAGAELAAAPSAIELRFDGRVQARFSRVDVLDARGASVRAADPVTLSADETTLTAALRPDLGAGAYRVRYTVVSADGHRQTGTFAFTIAAR